MGSLFGGGGDVQAPDYSQAIQTLQNAAQQAASMGTFNPVAITTSFGTPSYTYGPNGQLTGASYTAAPWLQALQQNAQNYAGQYQNLQNTFLNATQPLTAAQQAYGAGSNVYDLAQQTAAQQAGLYNVGQQLYGMGQGLAPYAQQAFDTNQTLATLAQQAAAQQAGFNATGQTLAGTGANLYAQAAQALPDTYDITEATQNYYDRMQQMVAPERERQLAKTRQNLFNTGRAGLAIGATQEGGQLATNPEMAAYYNAIAQQDLGLANQAEQQALSNLAQQTQIGQGLYSTGLQNYQAGLGAQQAGLGALQTGGSLYGQGLGALQTGSGITATGANVLGQGVGATQAGIGAGGAAANLYGQGTGLFGQAANLQNAYLTNVAASQVPFNTQMNTLAGMETMAQSPLQLGLQFGLPTMQGQQYGGNMIFQGAQGAANLQAQQAQANAAAANANNGPGFWESLGGSLLSTGLTAGLGALTGGLGTAAAGGLTGLFSGAGSSALGGLTGAGANLAGGINTGGFGGGYNPMQGFYTNPYSVFK